MTHRTVIVGASVAGVRVADGLRRRGYRGQVMVVGDEVHKPYQRPPLSKEFLAASAPHNNESTLPELAIRVRSTDSITWLLGERATGCDLGAGRVLLETASIEFDALAIATGVRPRRLQFRGGEARRYVLRTKDDAARLASALRPGTRLLVAGAGFIGCELAATALRLGCDVTVVDLNDRPMAGSCQPEVAAGVQAIHESHGVRFKLGRTIVGIESDARSGVAAVLLADGERLEADVVVEAIGSVPNVEWLDGNGLDLSDGVICDSMMRVGGRQNVVAAGDVARFPNALYCGSLQRIEHWTTAGETASRAALGLDLPDAGGTDQQAARALVPSFWSDQYDLKIKGVGWSGAADTWSVIEGDPERPADGVLAAAFEQGRIVAALSVNRPASEVLRYRTEIIDSAGLAAATPGPGS